MRAVPDGVDSASAKDLILELTEKFEKGDFDTKDKEALHMIACKAALKGNSRLDTSEIDKLVQELLETGGINTCPHGRPIMISYTKYEIEKYLKGYSNMRLIVIAGPTASGKTALAVRIAQRHGGEIVNADSMQVYKYMNIGTAKPDISERGGILTI